MRSAFQGVRFPGIKIAFEKARGTMVDEGWFHPLTAFAAMLDDSKEGRMFLRCFFIHKRVALTITASIVAVITVVWTPRDSVSPDGAGVSATISMNTSQDGADDAETYLGTVFALTAASGLGAVPFALMTLGFSTAVEKACWENGMNAYPDVLIGIHATFTENPGRNYHFFAVSDTTAFPA
jgi:hypothetical protein